MEIMAVVASVFQSRWFIVVAALLTSAAIWHYITHSYHTVLQRERKAPGSVMRQFIWGQVVLLSVILVILVLLAALALSLVAV